jgi:hypothetical protein
MFSTGELEGLVRGQGRHRVYHKVTFISGDWLKSFFRLPEKLFDIADTDITIVSRFSSKFSMIVGQVNR